MNAVNFVFLLRYPFPLQKKIGGSLGKNFQFADNYYKDLEFRRIQAYSNFNNPRSYCSLFL